MARKYWLMKSEEDVFPFEKLKSRPNQTEHWDGVRNYQARNFMRDEMKPGDRVLFYHSNSSAPGVVGIAEIASEAYPDHTAWDPESDYHDPKSNPDNPRWLMVDVRAVEDLPRRVTLKELKAEKKLAKMKVVQRGQRLSVQPVAKAEYDHVLKMARRPVAD